MLFYRCSGNFDAQSHLRVFISTSVSFSDGELRSLDYRVRARNKCDETS